MSDSGGGKKAARRRQAHAAAAPVSRARQAAAISRGLLVASLAGWLAARAWPDSAAVQGFGLAVLGTSLVVMVVAACEIRRSIVATRQARRDLERSKAEMRAWWAQRTPAERAQIAERLPGFRRLVD